MNKNSRFLCSIWLFLGVIVLFLSVVPLSVAFSSPSDNEDFVQTMSTIRSGLSIYKKETNTTQYLYTEYYTISASYGYAMDLVIPKAIFTDPARHTLVLRDNDKLVLKLDRYYDHFPLKYIAYPIDANSPELFAGVQYSDTQISKVYADSCAYSAGLRYGQKILAANNLSDRIIFKMFNNGKPLDLTVFKEDRLLRISDDSQYMTISITDAEYFDGYAVLPLPRFANAPGSEMILLFQELDDWGSFRDIHYFFFRFE